jgi:hypothetical protein
MALFVEYTATVAAAAATINGNLMPYMNDATVAVVAAAAALDVPKLIKKQASEVSKAHRMAKDAEKVLEQEHGQNLRWEQRQLYLERKEQNFWEREAMAICKLTKPITSESTRDCWPQHWGESTFDYLVLRILSG